MAEKTVRPDDLLKTEAERVPPPRATTPAARDTAGGQPGRADEQLLEDLRRLADRAGGLDRLRALLDELSRARG